MKKVKKGKGRLLLKHAHNHSLHQSNHNNSLLSAENDRHNMSNFVTPVYSRRIDKPIPPNKFRNLSKGKASNGRSSGRNKHSHHSTFVGCQKTIFDPINSRKGNRSKHK